MAASVPQADNWISSGRGGSICSRPSLFFTYRESKEASMILTGLEIKRQVALGNIKISDFNENQLGPNSYNLRLAPELMVYKEAILDPKRENRTATASHSGERPGSSPRASLSGQNHGIYRNSWLRSHAGGGAPLLAGTACSSMWQPASADVGFAGNWTLELSCIHPIVLYPRHGDLPNLLQHHPGRRAGIPWQIPAQPRRHCQPALTRR